MEAELLRESADLGVRLRRWAQRCKPWLDYRHLEVIAGYLAWSVVSYVAIVAYGQEQGVTAADTLTIGTFLCVFLAGFFLATRDKRYVQDDSAPRHLGVLLQVVAIVVLYLLIPFRFIPILSVVLATQLPFLLKDSWGVVLLLLLNLLYWAIQSWHWGFADSLVGTALNIAFNLFGFTMGQRILREQRAKIQIGQLNRELLATQALLRETVKQTERARISRDLHDMLGHHLTALILHLQYLSRTTQDKAQEKSAEALSLAKLLMSDVRQAVHDLREVSEIDLQQSLSTLVANVPNLAIELEYQITLSATDSQIAEILFRSVQEAITNTLKHSHATQMSIRISQSAQYIELQISDNGRASDPLGAEKLVEGNGLKGMRERVASVQGRLTLQVDQSVSIVIQLPIFSLK